MSGDHRIAAETRDGLKRPLIVACLRIAVGVWLLIATAIVLIRGLSGGWAALLLATAAVHFYLAYRNLAYRHDNRDD